MQTTIKQDQAVNQESHDKAPPSSGSHVHLGAGDQEVISHKLVGIAKKHNDQSTTTKWQEQKE